MADVILSVQFRSDGAPRRAAVGTYPIYPSAIRFSTAVRAHYSVRYVPGTMTVAAPPQAIAFVRKDQHGASIFNATLGTQTVALSISPTAGHLLLVILVSSAFNQNPCPVLTLDNVKNGSGHAYTRVGGSGYESVCGDTGNVNPVNDTRLTLSMWYRLATAADDESHVTFDVTAAVPLDPAAFASYQLIVLEYRNTATGSPVSANVKAEVSTVAGAGGITPFVLPNIALNGTLGQAVVAAFAPGITSGATAAPASYSFRYRGAGGSDPDNLDVIGVAVIERRGLSGLGPEQPTITTGLGAGQYAGMAIALTT